MSSISNVRSVGDLYKYIRENDKNGDRKINIKNEAPKEDIETLKKIDSDYVAFGDGEVSIQEILKRWLDIRPSEEVAIIKFENLIETIQNESIAVEKRRKAVEDLREFRNPKAVEAFIDLLNNKDPFLKSLAIDILGEIGDRSAIPALIETLKDPNYERRSSVLYSLGKMVDYRVREVLTKVFENRAIQEEALRLVSRGGKRHGAQENL
jgi:HEAT repeat protein